MIRERTLARDRLPGEVNGQRDSVSEGSTTAYPGVSGQRTSVSEGIVTAYPGVSGQRESVSEGSATAYPGEERTA